MNNLTRRKLLIAGFSLIVILLIVYGFLPKRQDVDLVAAHRGDFQVTIEEEGRTRLKQRFAVSAPTAGYMRRFDFKVGDAVKKGQTVVVLEPLRSPRLWRKDGKRGLFSLRLPFAQTDLWQYIL